MRIAPDLEMNHRTIYSVLERTVSEQGAAAALHQPYRRGGKKHYRTYTWAEYIEGVREIAAGLRTRGIAKGDVVALNSETRAEFYLADIGVMANGSIAAAMYTSYPAQDQVRTLRFSGARAAFVEDAKTLRALRGAAQPPLDLLWILLTGEADDAITLEQLRGEGRRAIAADPGMIARVASGVTPSDHAILYLTSGATGEPKCCLVTHAALVANIDMGPRVLPIGPEDRTLVFLPSAHIAQRVVLELLPLRMGTPVWFSESLAQLPHELKAIRPTFLLAPPRVWERIYTSICTEIRKRSAAARKLYYGSLGVATEASRLRQQGARVPRWMQASLKLADRLVFGKIRRRLGGSLRIAASGAAPLGKDLAQFFDAIGLPLVEGYGLTEGGVAAFNPLERPKVGSIGKPLPGVEMRLAEDGELLIKSPCLFSGYLHDAESTAAVLRDGWLFTGDIAEIDGEGYVYITGRKKELIVSSNGKKIYPSRIESLFKMEPLINQVVLIGDRLPYVSALFTLNTSAAETLEGMENLRGAAPAVIAAAGPVQAEIRQAVKRANQRLAAFEQIRKFRILERDFTIENGELTPTMKVRRGKVLQNFHAAVSELYAGREESPENG